MGHSPCETYEAKGMVPFASHRVKASGVVDKEIYLKILKKRYNNQVLSLLMILEVEYEKV